MTGKCFDRAKLEKVLADFNLSAAQVEAVAKLSIEKVCSILIDCNLQALFLSSVGGCEDSPQWASLENYLKKLPYRAPEVRDHQLKRAVAKLLSHCIVNS